LKIRTMHRENVARTVDQEPARGTRCRRHRRSSDPLIALHYALSRARQDGDLDAIVLADPSGIVVAGAGSWPVCEELAAYAPLLAGPVPVGGATSARLEALRGEVEVRALDVAGHEVLLCARGGACRVGVQDPHVTRAAQGIDRILRGVP
jgi:hypothetical protein